MCKKICCLLALICIFSMLPTAYADSVLSLPSGLKTIEDSAFEGDSSITAVHLPDGVESIASNAFTGSSLNSINLPETISFIADDAFGSEEEMENVEFTVVPGSYAYGWVHRGDDSPLQFIGDDAYNQIIEKEIFEPNNLYNLFYNGAACVFQIADYESLKEQFPGEPVWTVRSLDANGTNPTLYSSENYYTVLILDMAETPCTAQYEVKCSWGGYERTGFATVNWIVPAYVKGQHVLFGEYCDKPIEWVVLEKDEEKALLLSYYALDEVPFGPENSDVRWADSSLRSWMNTQFYYSAFSADERSHIVSSHNYNADVSVVLGGLEYSDGATYTDDYVFALSDREAFETYIVFANKELRKCQPTEYLLSKLFVGLAKDTREPIYRGVVNGLVEWWTRSTCIDGNENYIIAVNHEGTVSGGPPEMDTICVRPAIWVDVDAPTVMG